MHMQKCGTCSNYNSNILMLEPILGILEEFFVQKIRVECPSFWQVFEKHTEIKIHFYIRKNQPNFKYFFQTKAKNLNNKMLIQSLTRKVSASGAITLLNFRIIYFPRTYGPPIMLLM